jgi:hypothetical protein
MNNLYILTKQEFTSLYRFGQIPLILEKIIDIENKSNKEIDTKVFEVFISLPYFTGDEEYLIINFENKLINEIWLKIENVSEIIPLTKAAKNSYQMKFDSKLYFGQPLFESVVRKVEEEIDIQEMHRGAKTFWKLCKVDKEYREFLQNTDIKTAYFKRINGIKSSEFKEDFFIHLLAYDRYEFFPNNDLGFFYDVGEIFAHSKGNPSFKGSGFHSYLENNNADFAQKTFLDISDIISNSQDVVKFTQQLTTDNLKKYIVAAIFLKFKADLADRDTIKESETGMLIRKIREAKKFLNELNFSIYLTGTFFGYKKFYDDLYELSELKIFKKKPKTEQPDIKKKSENADNKIEIDKTWKGEETNTKSNVRTEKVLEKETFADTTNNIEKFQELEEQNVESVKVDKKVFNENQKDKIEYTEEDIPSLIYEYVSENGHCKIHPNIIDFVKVKTGKKYNVGGMERLIKSKLYDKLELKNKGKSKGVKLKDKEFSFPTQSI